jgi:DNA-binding MarR family transcriptional regulator
MSDISSIRQAVRTPSFDEALAARLGLNPTDLRCLEQVLEEPGLTPGRLAEQAGLTSGAITGVLDRLERGGFVVRHPDPADRRRITVEPVAARATEVRAAVAPLDEAIGTTLGRYSDDHVSTIAGFLRSASDLVAVETARLLAETRGGFVGDAYHAPLGDTARARLAFSSGAPRFALNVAPLGPRAAARLIAEPSASRLELTSGAPSGQLAAASFDGPRPDVRASQTGLEVRYRRQAISAFTSRRAKVELSAGVAWTIELDGGLTDLTGDLGGVTLERLEVNGGANHVDLVLPRPQGTVPVRLGGVASSARFRRPTGVPVAVRIAGGVSHLNVDGRRSEQVGGKRRYAGPGFDESPDRYEFEILGGASSVTITEG